MTKRSMQSPPANLPGIALMLAGALAPGLAVGQGVMQGFPPSPELRVNPANAFQPPYLRWSMRHARADGEAKASARAVGSTAAFSAMASAVLAALPG